MRSLERTGRCAVLAGWLIAATGCALVSDRGGWAHGGHADAARPAPAVPAASPDAAHSHAEPAPIERMRRWIAQARTSGDPARLREALEQVDRELAELERAKPAPSGHDAMSHSSGAGAQAGGMSCGCKGGASREP